MERLLLHNTWSLEWVLAGSSWEVLCFTHGSNTCGWSSCILTTCHGILTHSNASQYSLSWQTSSSIDQSYHHMEPTHSTCCRLSPCHCSPWCLYSNCFSCTPSNRPLRTAVPVNTTLFHPGILNNFTGSCLLDIPLLEQLSNSPDCISSQDRPTYPMSHWHCLSEANVHHFPLHLWCRGKAQPHVNSSLPIFCVPVMTTPPPRYTCSGKKLPFSFTATHRERFSSLC